ncbi:tetratricopeptide repeat protein [Pedobacter aquatilis]|uniref:tetratricopeptide repeat protein n=1 Tax=Pedobacter aquatilis TaxID=351343 RepID=UPI00292DA32C|nr:tetratricopeptide repeat protein [Pedobacter aquatilis]
MTKEDLEKLVLEMIQNLQFNQVMEMLSDSLLAQYSSAILYNFKAAALMSQGQFSLVSQYLDLAQAINPSDTYGYALKADLMCNTGDYEKAIEQYDFVLSIDPNYAGAYEGKGKALTNLKRYQEAIACYNQALTIKPQSPTYHRRRGYAHWYLELLDDAMADFDQAIAFKDPDIGISYNMRGVIFYQKKAYDKALKEFELAIQYSTFEKENAHFNKGLALFMKGKYDLAVESYNRSLDINPKYQLAYYERAAALEKLEDYEAAKADYQQYINLSGNPEEYRSQLSLGRIKELQQKIDNLWYNEIDILVDKIQSLLQFKDKCITHFTSLSSTKKMILENSPFRLSEGNFLNDTSEGKELFNYLSFTPMNVGKNGTFAETFTVRPFIGSFVSDTKHDDLTLWRMYGKEAQAEAKGCAITIHREDFVKALETMVTSGDDSLGRIDKEKNFTFFRVAYRTQNAFAVPGYSSQKNARLNQYMKTLLQQIKALTPPQMQAITKILNDIAYLFKSSEYQYENEVRLVVQGIGFSKNIISDTEFPRVYIELISAVPVLHKITLGPKVERADEWAAAFNYHIEQKNLASGRKVDICMSRLPFK